MKTCNRCNVEKSESEFSPKQTQCKTCRSEVRRERYQRNIEQELQWRKDGHKARRKQEIAYSNDYRKRNADKLKEARALWYSNNRDKVVALSKKFATRSRNSMSDCYIRTLIAFKRNVRTSDVPKDDPEIYQHRQQLIDKRIRHKVKDRAPVLNSK